MSDEYSTPRTDLDYTENDSPKETVNLPINLELEQDNFSKEQDNSKNKFNSTNKRNQYDQFIELNTKMENDFENMISKIKIFDNDSYSRITFNFRKDKFDKDICNKLTKLNQKIRIMDKKNSSYKNCYDSVNIGIILLSTILTLIESFKSEFDDTFSVNMKKYLRLSPIILSSIITCSASILKFKKFQEKIELLTKIKEKGVVMITKFKKLKENIAYVETIENLDKLIDDYNMNIYEQYALVQQEITQCISNKDYKYLFPIFDTDSKIHILNKKRSFFFNNYDYPKNPIIPEFIEKKCDTKKICCFF